MPDNRTKIESGAMAAGSVMVNRRHCDQSRILVIASTNWLKKCQVNKMSRFLSTRADSSKRLWVMQCIFIQKSSNHLLVLSVVFLCFFFKEFNARFAQRNCNFNSFIFKREFFWGRKKVRNNFHLTYRLIGVACFLFHISFFPSANIRHQRFLWCYYAK